MQLDLPPLLPRPRSPRVTQHERLERSECSLVLERRCESSCDCALLVGVRVVLVGGGGDGENEVTEGESCKFSNKQFRVVMTAKVEVLEEGAEADEFRDEFGVIVGALPVDRELAEVAAGLREGLNQTCALVCRSNPITRYNENDEG